MRPFTLDIAYVIIIKNNQGPYIMIERTIIFLSLIILLFSTAYSNDTEWLQKKGQLIFHDAFEREEKGNLAEAIGNGWNSATANRVPNIKMADLDNGILKINSATEAAGHAVHIHHDAEFKNGGVTIRFKFPDLNKSNFTIGFVDRKTANSHAGHLCYAFFSKNNILLRDHLTGVSNPEIMKIRNPYLKRKERLPKELTDLLNTKKISIPWRADGQWHTATLVTKGDEMRLSIDGKLIVKHRSEGYAHPCKRWFSLSTSDTVWIDDVKIWRVTLN